MYVFLKDVIQMAQEEQKNKRKAKARVNELKRNHIFYENNREKILAKKKLYYLKNKESRDAYTRKWISEHRERFNELNKKNKAKYRARAKASLMAEMSKPRSDDQLRALMEPHFENMKGVLEQD